MNKTVKKDAEYYSGMTVNERLFDASLLDAFEAAASSGNRGQMIELLRQVYVDSPEYTADSILENPSRYGF